MRVIRFGKSNFVVLDRYNLCQVSTLNLDRSLSVKIVVEL